MTKSFELQLDRLRDLITRVGPEPLFAAPLVTPDDAWFPDRWSPDLECVRRILLRMAELAGLQDLDVEVACFPEETAETRMPVSLIERRSESGAAGLFYGIHDGCAWFGIEEGELRTPRRLIGVLAHELAHAWRQVRGIQVTPRREEEECTDLTTIVLGFGILLCNTAYEYEMQSTVVGPFATTRWLHSRMGYLSVPDLSGLLACWAILKDLPRATIRKHLDTLQAVEFDAAWDRLREIDLLERLGIPAVPELVADIPEDAREREFTLSRAARKVHACVTRLVELAGDDGGFVTEPLPFPERAITLPHRMLATWGRISAAGSWTRSLALVSDPEWDTQAVVLIAQTGDVFARHALGHVRDRQAADRHAMQAWFIQLFAPASRLRTLLSPSLPTFVTEAVDAGVIGGRQLEQVFRSIADDADPDQVASETEWLLLHRAHTMIRLDLERTQGGIPRVPAAGRADTKRWWEAVSNGQQVKSELSDVEFYMASLRSKSGVQ
jgi:hypothetical protein